ncbi:MAG: hypothetical protein HKP27_01020 [Myxococcales bacterium]|nr:hypothetical protein [Myxococcales bacterium]
MTIQDWGSIGEAIGGIAVIASLVYLMIEVRQNTVTARLATVQTIADSFANWTAALGRDPKLVELYVGGLGDSKTLSATEQLQFDFLVLTLVRKLENAFAQYRGGNVQEVEWRSWSVPIRLILSTPGGKRWWAEWSGQLSDEFRTYVDGEHKDSIAPNQNHPVARAVREQLGMKA